MKISILAACLASAAMLAPPDGAGSGASPFLIALDDEGFDAILTRRTGEAVGLANSGDVVIAGAARREAELLYLIGHVAAASDGKETKVSADIKERLAKLENIVAPNSAA